MISNRLIMANTSENISISNKIVHVSLESSTRQANIILEILGEISIQRDLTDKIIAASLWHELL